MQFNVSHYDTLQAAQDAAIARIDTAAGKKRAQYLTTIPGQMATYEYKLQDAQAYLAASSPTLADFPWIEAEVQATGQTPQVAAQAIVAHYQAWLALGVAIERERMAGKASVRQATDRAQAYQAASSAVQTIDSIGQVP